MSLHSGMTFLSQVSMKDKAEAARENILTERTVPGLVEQKLPGRVKYFPGSKAR